MPKVSCIGGISIYMYYLSHDQRLVVPHFHVIFNRYDVVVAIGPPPRVLIGNLSTEIRDIIFEFARVHERELKQNWQNILEEKRILEISPRSNRKHAEKNVIVDCLPKNDYSIWIKFADGVSGEVPLCYLANRGIFQEAWATQFAFDQVKINPETGALTWRWGQYEVDLDPQALRELLLSFGPKDEYDFLGIGRTERLISTRKS